VFSLGNPVLYVYVQHNREKYKSCGMRRASSVSARQRPKCRPPSQAGRTVVSLHHDLVPESHFLALMPSVLFCAIFKRQLYGEFYLRHGHRSTSLYLKCANTNTHTDTHRFKHTNARAVSNAKHLTRLTDTRSIGGLCDMFVW